MAEYTSYHPQIHKPSTYSATITTDQIIISRHEYNELVESKLRLGQANETIVDLKNEIAMLKDVVQRVVGFYSNSSTIIGTGMNENSTTHQKDDIKGRIKATKSTIRRDSGVDGVGNHESDEQSDPRSAGRNPGREDGITPVKRSEPVSFPLPKRTALNELNLLDLDEGNEEPGPIRQNKTTTLTNGTYDTTGDKAEVQTLYSRIATRRLLETPVVLQPSPSMNIRKDFSELEAEPELKPQLEYELFQGVEERASTPASWEQTPAVPQVTFDDFNAEDDDWKKSTDWDPTPAKFKENERVTAAGSSRLGPTPIQPVKSDWPEWRSSTIPPTIQDASDTVEDFSPSTPIPLMSSGPKTARQLYLEKKSLNRALAEVRTEQLATSSATSSTGDVEKIVAEPDPSTFRHIYIPNLPGDVTLSTLSSVIRTNGQGAVEFISLFRQKADSLDYPNFDDPGSGENIGVNITFTTAEACDVWFKFLFENSSQRLQGNPTKTWLFPNEDSAAEWRKCAVFRRSDYHPSIAGKIDKGGPGGQATMAEAQKRGATRVLLVTGLPADVTESDLAWLALPPGNRSLTYEGPTHLASGQAGLSTEEFARWKWLEKIVIEDEPLMGFGDGERRKIAKIYAAGVKTAYLARGKIWKKYNRNGAIVGKSTGGYVKVEFIKDECEGPLEELPPWVVVGGDDDEIEFGDVGGRDTDD